MANKRDKKQGSDNLHPKQERGKPFPAMEEEILSFWEKNNIFAKSVTSPLPRRQAGHNSSPSQAGGSKEYVFYDGPPFATGTPHYGHIVASIMKDVVPRYWTMKGCRVERKWGWDCHGLPIENIVEKELGFKSKKDIEKLGIEKFNETCRSKVLTYVDEWQKVIRRLGRWADMENAYKTMDRDYMESIWWVFKQLWDKGLVYEGYRSMHICPRCETTLSQMEVAEGYKEVKDLAVTVKFQLEPGQKIGDFVTDDKTYILAWTTTPWTLPGNVALAVGESFDYLIIKAKNTKNNTIDNFILAKDRWEYMKSFSHYPLNQFKVGIEGNQGYYEIEQKIEVKGKDLVGKKYKPPFDYYSKDKTLKNRENGWKVYAADFVTAEDGTGIAHEAPAFGADDWALLQKENLPFVQHVNMDGTFKDEVTDFKGLHVKPIEDTQKTDVEIIKYLAKHNLLFSKEKYEHSYPHCWRCDTPLINYATSSWFVKVTAVKDNAKKQAKEINWMPGHIKDGRFGQWLEGARDWSISRQRFWASVIPIWKCEKCGEVKVFGSVADLEKVKIDRNTFFIMRHGESERNVNHIFSSQINTHPLTKKGEKHIKEQAKKIKDLKIDLIFCSSMLRARQTAQIVGDVLKKDIVVDERLHEINVGIFEGKDTQAASSQQMLSSMYGNYTWSPEGGESIEHVERRVMEFWREINSKHEGKNILIVSHGDALRALSGNLIGLQKEALITKQECLSTGEFMRAEQKIYDLHKHIIDKITFKCGCGAKMKRIPDVLDTWFDSASMPYAQEHYPFENKEKFEQNFPAEFIAEGVDQTRAWFYYLHIIATAIKQKPAFKNVIVNGIVLAEDGKKMAKRLQNYPDPMAVMREHGADKLRYYLCSTAVVKAEDLNFSERELVDQTRFFNILLNVLTFYKMFSGDLKIENLAEKDLVNVLDKWITARLEETKKVVTQKMDNYDLHAIREIPVFINDLSTWYLRRSRERLKGDDEADKIRALKTLRRVLYHLARIMAPFLPFTAEHIYQELGADVESVHLKDWPEVREEWIDKETLANMEQVRKIVEMGLAERDKAGIKVKQPLQELGIRNYELRSEYTELIQDELNVKKVTCKKGEGDLSVELNTALTPELIQEGIKRELTRAINNARKEAGMTIQERAIIYYQTESKDIKAVLKKFGDEIKKDTLSDSIAEKENEGKEININGEKIKLKIENI
ncbi:MAG: class I tRNA ligase family protein [bacterium]|nr:class I tRNA ligase family protein [bacterium]